MGSLPPSFTHDQEVPYTGPLHDARSCKSKEKVSQIDSSKTMAQVKLFSFYNLIFFLNYLPQAQKAEQYKEFSKFFVFHIPENPVKTLWFIFTYPCKNPVPRGDLNARKTKAVSQAQ